jgi:hypothetical protein
VIAPGNIAPRQDSSRELYVAVLSNSIVAISRPEGTLLPELVQWLPTSALGEPIGTTGPAALTEATSIVTALIS